MLNLRVLIGALIGAFFGIFSGVLLLSMIFGGFTVPGFLTTIVATILALGSFFQPLPLWTAYIVWYILNVLVFWLLAIPVQASLGIQMDASGNPVPPVDASGVPIQNIPVTNLQNLFHGFGYGTAATINLVILSPFYSNPAVLILGIVSMVPLLAVIPAVRLNLFFQGVIAWPAWFLPTHWLGNLAGFVVFLVLLPFALVANGTAAVRLDLTSGAIETLVPAGPFNQTYGAFNLAFFTFLIDGIPEGPFLDGNVSSHEVGHHINSSAMTPFFSAGAVIEEMRVFSGASRFAVGQLEAESRGAPRNRVFNAFWSL